MRIGDIAVDVCDGGCGGIWFDRFELMKVDEPHENAGQMLLEIERDPTVSILDDGQRKCPHCEDMNMVRHFHSVKHQVAVDECYQCGGIWLDVGELATVRRLYSSEEERRAAAAGFFDDLFGEDLNRMHQESQESEAKAQRIARAFRFICPSYYIPGKQPWGAF